MKNDLTSIQTQIDSLYTNMKNFFQYVSEDGLKFNATGTNEEQTETLETTLDKMKDILQQKNSVNERIETIMNEMSRLFQIKNQTNETIEEFNDKIVWKLWDLENERHSERLKELEKYLTTPINKDVKGKNGD